MEQGEEELRSRTTIILEAEAVRDFKKFFKRRERCGDPNHLIGEYPKPPKDKNQRAFVGGSWSDSGKKDDEKAKYETCLMAQASSETVETASGFHATPSALQSDSVRILATASERSRLKETLEDSASQDKDDYSTCMRRKQAHAYHKAKNIVSTTRCLELLHMDLFCPSAIRSYGGNLYSLVIIDDYSRMDHGRDFDNEVQYGEFCNANSITHNFSAPRTPQSNGVVERKNRTLQEMKRGDGIASIKRWRRDFQSDTVKDFVTASGRSRLKEDLESSTWQRRHGFKAMPLRRFSFKYETDLEVLSV
ncbi:retrovirus-related pol polyprotein from transposon TNT 1-94 [Tanacetum coccineum]